MGRSYQAIFCALIIVAFFTLDSKALSRVEHRGYRPANTTAHTQPKQWQAPQHHQGPGAYATTRSPMQAPQWNQAGGGGGGNYNQWNPYNQSIGVSNSKNWNQYNQTTNPWQRYNNTIGGGGANHWNMQPQRPFVNQSHLYPQLPGQNVNGGHRPFQAVPTAPQRSNGQWNQTLQQPGYGTPTNRSQNWWPNQNKTNWNVAPTTPQPFYRPPNANNGVGVSNGWGSNSNSGYPVQSGQPGQANWANWAQNNRNQTNNWLVPSAGQPNTNPGWGSTNNLANNPNNPNSWQPTGNNNGGPNPYNPNNNNNQNNYGQNNGQQAGNGGAQLAPLGGNTMAGGQQLQPSNGIPLAPIGGSGSFGGAGADPGGAAGSSPFGWNSGSVKNPNSWNHANSNGAPQLAPLAPLSYGNGGGVSGGNGNSNIGNNGGSNPYANMFNK